METPYINPVTPIDDPDRFFKRDPKSGAMIFIGETLEVRIPQRLEVYGLLSVEDDVTTLGVMDMIFDGKYQFPLMLLAKFTMSPTDSGSMTYKGVPYAVYHFKTGDVFMTSTKVVRDTTIVYALWVEFITRGKPIYTMTYRGLALMFDQVKELTGQGTGVGRTVFEAIVAFLSRDPKAPAIQYRLTSMKEPFRLIALRSVSLAPTGTTARMNGSYQDNGITAALRYQVTDNQPFEDILRGVPQAMGFKPADDID